jgi:uncharacterized protein (DUF488 family)
MTAVLERKRGGGARTRARPQRRDRSGAAAPAVWTLGHSTRPLPEFLELLGRFRIEALADVRRFAASRRHPQFAAAALEEVLGKGGIEYRWLPELGGRRRPRPDSPHTAWRNASFRGYADHMDSAEFTGAFEGLMALARRRRTAIMCAEALWWRCHRALIADALQVRGFAVLHIFDESDPVAHPFTPAARIIGGRLSYSAAPSEPRRAGTRRSR